MIMNDRVKTRIKISGVTSYASDKGYNYAAVQSWPTINMTIGSVAIVLNYDKVEDRDSDIERLDNAIDQD